MTRIELKNTITIDDQIELFHEVYEGQVQGKGDWLYLTYRNSDKEQVVIKLKDDQLVMTRFSTPQSQMKFQANSLASATVPTPIGVQKLVTRSKSYQLNPAGQQVSLAYDLLLSPESDLPLASYDLIISWS